MYNDALCTTKGEGIVFLTAGTLRGDSVYGPGAYTNTQSYVNSLTPALILGNMTIGDILGILPFKDPLVMLELDGETIWAALESGLRSWPAHEG